MGWWKCGVLRRRDRETWSLRGEKRAQVLSGVRGSTAPARAAWIRAASIHPSFPTSSFSLDPSLEPSLEISLLQSQWPETGTALKPADRICLNPFPDISDNQTHCMCLSLSSEDINPSLLSLVKRNGSGLASLQRPETRVQSQAMLQSSRPPSNGTAEGSRQRASPDLHSSPVSISEP